MDRFKKFVKKHEDILLVVTTGTAIIAIAAYRGREVVTCDISTRDDGLQMINLRQRNGMSRIYTKTEK